MRSVHNIRDARLLNVARALVTSKCTPNTPVKTWRIKQWMAKTSDLPCDVTLAVYVDGRLRVLNAKTRELLAEGYIKREVQKP